MSFRRADAGTSREPFQCDVHGEVHDAVDHGLLSSPAPMTVTGAIQRDYRAAFADEAGAILARPFEPHAGLAGFEPTDVATWARRHRHAFIGTGEQA